MSAGDSATVERIIANTINETARGDPDALAARIVVASAEAGFRIVPASGRDETALGHRRAKARQLYRSPNGDSWFLARDPATGSAFVRHRSSRIFGMSAQVEAVPRQAISDQKMFSACRYCSAGMRQW